MVSLDQSAADSLLIVAVAYALWKLVPILIHPYTSAIRNLPGPPNPDWLYGDSKDMRTAGKVEMQQKWVREYGPNIMLRGVLGRQYLITFDTRALNHILTRLAIYQRPEKDRRPLSSIFGNGLLVAEGQAHRKQRRVLNPAFGPAQIRDLTAIFVQKSTKLRQLWSAEIAHTESGEGYARLNIIPGLTKLTMDIIGSAGFNYDFDSLSGKDTELSRALSNLFTQTPPVTPMEMIRAAFPVLGRLLPGEQMRRIADAQNAMRRVGLKLIADKKAAILREMADKKLGMERKDMVDRDLLTLLIRANMATDIPDSQRLSDDDVIAQVPTFIVAGHETTSGASTWGLYALAHAPEVQRKLREELLTVQTENPMMDELQALPYLDAFVRETLRMYAPVSMIPRVAMEDDVIPVSAPFVDRFGQTQDAIRISKGTGVVIPILAMNLSKELWGEDAAEFKPERWETLPEATASVPGVWAHLMTFLSGPRACIGYRFSIIEMKAMIFTLVRAFEFAPAVPNEEIVKAPTMILRPVLKSAPEQGSQMPLLVRPHRRA